jgi:hypothetical protein
VEKPVRPPPFSLRPLELSDIESGNFKVSIEAHRTRVLEAFQKKDYVSAGEFIWLLLGVTLDMVGQKQNWCYGSHPNSKEIVRKLALEKNVIDKQAHSIWFPAAEQLDYIL